MIQMFQWHRKQKFSYATSGINPKDLHLLDDGSEDEIQSLPLEERSERFVDAGVGAPHEQRLRGIHTYSSM